MLLAYKVSAEEYFNNLTRDSLYMISLLLFSGFCLVLEFDSLIVMCLVVCLFGCFLCEVFGATWICMSFTQIFLIFGQLFLQIISAPFLSFLFSGLP